MPGVLLVIFEFNFVGQFLPDVYEGLSPHLIPSLQVPRLSLLGRRVQLGNRLDARLEPLLEVGRGVGLNRGLDENFLRKGELVGLLVRRVLGVEEVRVL